MRHEIRSSDSGNCSSDGCTDYNFDDNEEDNLDDLLDYNNVLLPSEYMLRVAYR